MQPRLQRRLERTEGKAISLHFAKGVLRARGFLCVNTPRKGEGRTDGAKGQYWYSINDQKEASDILVRRSLLTI